MSHDIFAIGSSTCYEVIQNLYDYKHILCHQIIAHIIAASSSGKDVKKA